MVWNIETAQQLQRLARNGEWSQVWSILEDEGCGDPEDRATFRCYNVLYEEACLHEAVDVLNRLKEFKIKPSQVNWNPDDASTSWLSTILDFVERHGNEPAWPLQEIWLALMERHEFALARRVEAMGVSIEDAMIFQELIPLVACTADVLQYLAEEHHLLNKPSARHRWNHEVCRQFVERQQLEQVKVCFHYGDPEVIVQSRVLYRSALASGSLEVVQLFVEHGASPREIQTLDFAGVLRNDVSPLERVMLHQYWDIAEWLVLASGYTAQELREFTNRPLRPLSQESQTRLLEWVTRQETKELRSELDHENAQDPTLRAQSKRL